MKNFSSIYQISIERLCDFTKQGAAIKFQGILGYSIYIFDLNLCFIFVVIFPKLTSILVDRTARGSSNR